MTAGALTPEELETLLEDAFVVRDRGAVARLFEDGAVLAAGGAARPGAARRSVALARRCGRATCSYVAGPAARRSRRATRRWSSPQRAINVVRRGRDGGWRYAISLLDSTHRPKEDTMTQVDGDARARRGRGALVVRRRSPRSRRRREDTGRAADDRRGDRAAGRGGAAARPPPRGRGLLDPRGRASRFEVGDETIEASAGDFALGPARHPAPLHRRPERLPDAVHLHAGRASRISSAT